MPKVRYQPLGPLHPGKTTSRAVLALQIPEAAPLEARPVVLVWLPEEAAKSQETVAAVEKETARAAILEHPNIIRVYGFSEQPEGKARVVEYADGETLRTVLNAAKKLPANLAALIAVDAATGLHYAHLAGNDDGTPLVHADIRPETLLVAYAGITKVSGYGALAVAPREPGGRRVQGRRQHCAPEQVLGGRDAVNVQTDVYLLGLALHECITGQVPFQEELDFDQAVLSKPVADLPPELCPPALNEVIKKAMAKRAAERYPTVLALREAIEAAIGELPSRDALASFLKDFFPEDQTARAARRALLEKGLSDLAKLPMPPSPAPTPSPAAAQEKPAPAAAAPTPAAATATSATSVASSQPASAKPAAPVATPPPGSKGGKMVPFILGTLAGLVVLSVYALWRGGAERLPWQTADQHPVAIVAAADAGTQLATTPLPATDAGAALATTGVPDASVLAGAEGADGGAASTGVAGTMAGAAAAGALDGGEPALFVYVEPPVEVAIDGKPVGRTPVTVPIPPGRKVLKLSDHARNIATTRVVTVADKGITSARIYLHRGFVNVIAPKGSEIFLDGRSVGLAPQRELGVYEGTHQLMVDANGARWQKSFEAKPNEHLKFEVAFQ